MLGQVLLGSFMHVWDCLSDCYVVYLWYEAGSTGLFAAGCLFLLLSTMLTGATATALVGRFGMVFGFLALREVGEERTAYSQYTYLKGMHGGLQSVPLAIMTGVDLLTGGAKLDLLVKVTSLGLSVFSVSFTCVIYSADLHKFSFERAVDYFMLTCLDMVWMIISFGWIAAAFSPLFSGIAIGVAYGVVCLVLYAMFWHTFHPHDRDYMQANLLPFQVVFGWPKTQVDDIMAGKLSTRWVLPLVCLINCFVYGSTPYIFDLAFLMPQPGARRIQEGKTLATHLSVTRRLALAALGVVHLVERYSSQRVWLTVGIATLHTYFSLRMWDRLKLFSLSALLRYTVRPCVRLVFALVLWPYIRIVAAVVRRRVKQKEAVQRISKLLLLNTTRPKDKPLSGQESEFFDICDKILSLEQQASSQKSEVANSRNWFCLRQPVTAGALAKRKEILGLVQQGADLFAADVLAGTGCAHIDVVTGVLVKHYQPSMDSEEKLETCCSALRDLLGGRVAAPETTEGSDLPLHAIPVPPLFSVSFRTVANAFVWDKSCDTNKAFELARKAEDNQVNFFCSHSWRDDASSKASVLRTFLFMQSSVAVTLISTIIFVITFIPGGFIVSSLAPSIPWWAMSLSSLVTGSLVLCWGIVSHVLGLDGFVPWRWCGYTFWLDKCCIDQRTEASKQVGIAHLGDSLESSSCMLVIFSEAYLQRLWCTYELARYCRLIKAQEEAEARGEKVGVKKRLMFLSLSWTDWWNPATWSQQAELSNDETTLLLRYDCREAKFWKRADQVAVLGLIREEWSSEEAFNDYVHTKLPAILLQGKREYYNQIKKTMWNSFVTLFGS